MKMPETGFDKPFFIGEGLLDTNVPYAATAKYVATLQANHQPVTFKTYDTDHSGALIQAERDEIPFIAELFAHARRGRR
jgi:predicted esterase